MWKRVSFVRYSSASFAPGHIPVDKTECFHKTSEPHDDYCRIGWRSGDKWHVVSHDQEDIDLIRPILDKLHEKWGTGDKTTTDMGFENFKQFPEQLGKGVTIYGVSRSHREGIQKDLHRELTKAGYYQHLQRKYGDGLQPIQNDHMITSAIGFRHDYHHNDGDFSDSYAPITILRDSEGRPYRRETEEMRYVRGCNCEECNPDNNQRTPYFGW